MTLVLSTISYEYYENWYRKLSQQRVVLLFTGLFLLNLWVFLALLRCPVVRNAADSYYYGQGKLTSLSAEKADLQYPQI